MSDDNLSAYERYFQYRDPITHKLQRRRRATAVSTILSQRELERTEFFNDFLARDGLCYGMNLYAWDGSRNIGDLRVWRRRQRDNFTRRDVEAFDLVRPHFLNAMRNVRRVQGRSLQPPGSATLTAREADVAAAVVRGLGDAEIAAELGISYSTVRTHLKNIYRKLGVRSRTAMAARLGGH